MGDGQIVGRGTEIGLLEETLDQFAGGDGHRLVACLISGEPGSGKTTLWGHAVDRARERGLEVLACRLGEAETKLSFAGLTDLLDRVGDAEFRALPDPQRTALEVALLRRAPEGAPPDPRAVSLAVLTLVRTLSMSRPVVLAVDDAQWLDPATASVVSYVARRSAGMPVGILVAVRTAGDSADPAPFGLDKDFGPDQVRRVEVGGLATTDLYRLVQLRTGIRLGTPDLRRLDQVCGGNPLLALELVRGLAGQPAERRAWWLLPTDALPLSSVLARMVADRVEALPAESREVLLAAAALRQPTVAMLRAVLGGSGSDVPGLAAAEEAGVVEVTDGSVTFAHPLFSSAVYANAGSERRRALHAGLAAVVADLDQRAWHLALAVDGPSAEVAEALSHAAAQTQRRGAPTMAAELWRLAGHRTPPGDPRRHERAVSAAECLFSAGDGIGARRILEESVSEMPPSPQRARGLLWLASILYYDGSPREAVATLQRAIPEAGPDRVLTGLVHLRISWFAEHDTDLRLSSAETARQFLEGTANPAAQACALLGVAFFGFQAGRAPDHRTLERGRRLLPDRDFDWEVEFSRAMLYLWAKNFDLPLARAGWLAKYRRAHEIGDEPGVPHALLHLVEIECWLGELATAERYAAEMAETTDRTGQRRWRGQALFATALVAAHRWDPDRAVADATEGLALAESLRDNAGATLHLSVLGFVELSRGASRAADRYLTRAADNVAGMGIREPARYTFFADQIEVCLQLADVERAGALADRLDRRAQASPYPYLLCTAARSRALVALAQGDVDAALAASDVAVRAHEGLPMPFELARTLLVRGHVLRRAKQKRAAGEALDRAGETFARLGMTTWAERATAERQSLGLRRTSPTELTPAELRVAELVAGGRTNDEVAAALFLSRRTVEAHLARIYRKVGVRSRTELARSFAEHR